MSRDHYKSQLCPITPRPKKKKPSTEVEGTSGKAWKVRLSYRVKTCFNAVILCFLNDLLYYPYVDTFNVVLLPERLNRPLHSMRSNNPFEFRPFSLKRHAAKRKRLKVPIDYGPKLCKTVMPKISCATFWMLLVYCGYSITKFLKSTHPMAKPAS